MKKIAVTGTIGSGKSTVSILLRRRHLPVFDADHYSRICLHRDHPVYAEIVKTFGTDILDEEEEIDRKKLASIVFSSEEKRFLLNGLVHPYVLAGLEKFFESHADDPLVFAEIPLLYEAGWQKYFDEVLVVTCEDDTAVKRLMEYRNFTEEDAEARLRIQISKQQQLQKADLIIHNDGSLKELDQAVGAILKELRGGKRHGA